METILEEKQLEQYKDEALDEWIKIWKNKKFPMGHDLIYSEWRRFREYWFWNSQHGDKLLGLPINLAYRIYNNEKNKVVVEFNNLKEEK